MVLCSRYERRKKNHNATETCGIYNGKNGVHDIVQDQKCILALNHLKIFDQKSYIRRIRPFLSHESAQLLIQTSVLSKLHYCNPLLTGLTACALKPLQLIQNAVARLVFNQPKFSHVSRLPLAPSCCPH